MKTVAKFFYSVWVLSLPFYAYSVVGTLSIDNLLAPLVMILCFLKYVSFPANKSKKALITTLLLVFLLYAVGVVASVVSDFSYVKLVFTELLKHALYFFIPLLFINNFRDLKLTLGLVVVVTILGCTSVLLAAMGVVELAMVRTSPSRLDFVGLPKSVGLLSNYGDLAIVSSMALLTVFSVKGIMRKASARIYTFMIIVTVVIGYFGAQSRSMALAIMSSVAAYWYVKKFLVKGSNKSAVGIFLLVIGVLFGLGLMVMMSVDVVDSLASWGGAQASATANDRLGQYAFAWGLFKSSPFLGDGKTIVSTGIIVHNLWMDTLARGGLIAVLAMFLLFFVTAKRSMKKQYTPFNREISAYSTGVLTSIFVAGQFYGGFTYIFLFAFGVSAVAMTLTTKTAPVMPKTRANIRKLHLQGGTLDADAREKS